MGVYPQLEINVEKITENVRQVVRRCGDVGIEVVGVVKGCHSLPCVCKAFVQGGCGMLASSRLDQIEPARAGGVEAPFMLIRVPMRSELPDLVRLAAVSLQSELEILDELEAECARQNKGHDVIVMADLGDLREGFWDKEELVAVCAHVERDLPHVHLLGVGTNLGCYGSIKPTVAKMEELVALAERVEAVIARRLEIISGGATSSFTLVHDGVMPPRINHLRIGEGIILAYDLQAEWGYEDMGYLATDAFTLRAEVVEVKDKPSCPVGEIFIDCFCNVASYEDRGVRRRALLAVGNVDVCAAKKLRPRLGGIEVLGASSDHTILDIEDCAALVRVGDVLEFDICYTNLVYLVPSRSVEIVEV